jgi:hypothetical protein
MHIELWWERQKERVNYADSDVSGKIILTWIVQKHGVAVCSEPTWLRTATSGRLCEHSDWRLVKKDSAPWTL